MCLAAYAAIMLRGPQGVSALQERRREVRSLQEENANLARDIELKKERIERLKSDAGTQELEVRKRLKMQHKDDREFILPDAKIAPNEPSEGSVSPAHNPPVE